MGIYCCKDCGHKYEKCHGSCPEYLEQKAEYDKRKEEYDKKRYIRQALYSQRDINVRKAMRHRRKGNT